MTKTIQQQAYAMHLKETIGADDPRAAAIAEFIAAHPEYEKGTDMHLALHWQIKALACLPESRDWSTRNFVNVAHAVLTGIRKEIMREEVA